MKRPPWFTKKQEELIILMHPAPIGMGLSIVDSAELLGITQQAAYARLCRFKKRFPKAWEQVEVARKINRRHGHEIRAGAEHGHKFDSEKHDFMIEEKF
jgi:hypothetical protein